MTNPLVHSSFTTSAIHSSRAVDHGVRDDLRQAAAKVRRLEHILEDSSDVYPGPLVRIQTQRAMAEVQRPDIVESKNVIGVAMRNQDCIQSLQTMTQCLLPKIR